MASRLPGTGIFSARVLRIALTLAFVFALAFPASAMAALILPSDPTPDTPLFDLDDARIPPGVVLPQKSSAAGLPTGDNRIDALLSGSTLDTAGQATAVKTITYSFYEDDVFHGTYGGSETGVREVSEGIKTNARSIFAWYSTIINVNFVEVTETPTTAGTFRIMLSDGPGYAYAYYPMTNHPLDVSSDVHLNPGSDDSDAADTNSFQNTAGSHGYMSLAHEIGHAMGLKHPFSMSPVLPQLDDNTANTIMSYTFTGTGAATPMAYDVAALQRMYGARAKNTGDDTYVFTSRGTDQYTLGASMWQVTPRRTKQTIWDSAGFDTIDASLLPYSSSGYRFNDGGKGWLIDRFYEREASSTNLTHYFQNGSSLAFDFAPEKFVNSSSNDWITANSLANTFAGYTLGRSVGDDRIRGASAADKLDLTAYPQAAVTKTTSGTDLILGLGSAGSVTLVDYYDGSSLTIAYFGTPANQPPIARPTVSATSGIAPLTVNYSSSTSTDPDGSIESWVWSFSDGSSVPSATASKTYAAVGTYSATLTVRDNDGASASAVTTVSVIPAIGSLAGTVTSEGQPLAGATVAVAGLTTTTDGLGAYSMASIPATAYPATFSKSGYASQTVTVTISHQQTTTKSVSLVREVGTLSGTVKYGTLPIAGASVSVAGLTTITAADGTYSIGSIPKGSQTATYTASGYITQGVSVTVNTGATTTKTVYLARETGVFTGTVTAGGQPVASVRVMLADRVGYTNSLGVYTITGIPTGSHTASFTKLGYTAQHVSATIAANQTTTLDVSLDRELGALSGVVTSSALPLSGVSVTLSGAAGATTTGSDGVYTLTGIAPGTYTVTFSKAGHIDQTVSVTILAGGVASTDVQLFVSPVTRATTTRLAGYSYARLNRSYKLSGGVFPAGPGKVTIVKQRLVGRTWKSAGTVRVSVSDGKFSHTFRPRYRGTWRFVATYSGGVSGVTTYKASKSLRKTVKVK